MPYRPVAVDLFCGAGGMSLGFEQAGFDIAVAVDSDAHHVATHERNFPYGKVLLRSVADVSGAELRELAGAEIDLVFGGPPCQGFSHMGLRDALDPRNTLVSEFARVVREVCPKAFVMENVPGMQTGKTRPIFEHVLDSFRAAGYRITWPVRTLNASDFGVPQTRERLFVLGVREDLGVAEIPYPTICGTKVTVAEALEDLPDVDLHESLQTDSVIPYDRAPVSPYARIRRGAQSDPNDLSHPRLWERELCTGCQRVKHGAEVIRLYDATPPGSMVPGHKLPRLAPEGFAPTLRAGSGSEHGSYTAPRPVHPFRPRCITAREAARLHGYPDWFRFYPAKWHAYRQIGNSVCPPVAREIGKQIVNALGIAVPAPVKAIGLSDEFRLAEERPRTHRRLVEADEFPKVLERLYAATAERGSVLGAALSVRDIARAIAESGAQVPRIRPECFLSAVAKSRNAERILRCLIERGVSLRLKPGGEGEFVPAGSPGSLERKDFLSIQSAELTSCQRSLDGEFDDVAEYLEMREVVAALSPEWRGGCLERGLLGLPANPISLRLEAGRKSREALVWRARADNAPKPSKLMAELEDRGVDLAIICLAATDRHLLFIALEAVSGMLAERGRAAFLLESRSLVWASV